MTRGASGLPARLRADPGEHALARSVHGSISLVVASLIILGLLIAGITGYLVVQSREQALLAAEHELRRLALTLADQAERSFEAVDLVQTTFMEMVRNGGAQTAEDFRERMSTLEVNKALAAHSIALPQLDAIGLVDADGAIINFSTLWPTPDNSISDRDYFQALRGPPGQQMVVSDPIMNRVTHKLAVVIGHRIESANGGFLGISFAGVLMSYFENLYKTVANDGATGIALLRSDGVLMARYPRPEAARRTIEEVAAGRLSASGPYTDSNLRTRGTDGTDFLIAAHALNHYPMLVAVSASTGSILSAWRKQAIYLIAVATILELVVAAAGVLTLRQSRSQRMLADARAELALGQERERADRQMRIQAARFGAALGNMSEVLCMFDARDSMLVGNDRLASVLGLTAGSIAPGTTLEDLRDLLAGPAGVPPDDLAQLHSLIVQMKCAGERASHALDMADGRRLAVNFAALENGGWLVTLEDISEQRRVEAKIEHMAHHDALTGLANRMLFRERLAEAVARCRRGERWAVLYLDLDHFKAVNDTLGHPAGDALLCEVTQRLKRQTRSYDTVARLGGDEFAIVQSIRQPEDSSTLADRLIEAIGAPYEISGTRVTVGTSIGIAIVPGDGADVDDVIKNADMALYQSKTDGRGRYSFFESAMEARVQARLTLELELRKAWEDGDFIVYYQPLINIATRAVCGFEALLRWLHPERGLISPSNFIPIAEETGLIVPLGRWVLRQACADAACWADNLKVAVNLSPAQFGSHTLVEDVEAALADSGLPAERLELEITETAILADTDTVLNALCRLRDLGLKVALDDFGTGYSSLSYLQRFPFSKVKIDRSFVSKLGHADSSDTIVSAAIDLCGRLGMTTTGEGVETPAQLDRLAALNCTEAQGLLFSPARPADAVDAMLRWLDLRNPTGLETAEAITADHHSHLDRA